MTPADPVLEGKSVTPVVTTGDLTTHLTVNATATATVIEDVEIVTGPLRDGMISVKLAEREGRGTTWMKRRKCIMRESTRWQRGK